MKNIFFAVIFNCTFLCLAQDQFVVYFTSNKSDLSKVEQVKLDHWIDLNKESKIFAINGFTDEDGTTTFNDSLAKKRVDFISSYVSKKVFIRDDFKSRSYGENFIQSKNKSDNRKVVIYFLSKKELDRENEILGIVPIQTAKIIKTPREFSEKLDIDNPDGSHSQIKLNRQFMQTIDQSKVGDKLVLENINFVINTFSVTNSSRPKMFELLAVLRQNTKLKIEIQGNLCCQPIDRLNLSTERAKTIYNFLVFYKIDKSRLSYKGLGSSNPLYPLPEKSDEERAANRRVEILIVENE